MYTIFDRSLLFKSIMLNDISNNYIESFKSNANYAYLVAIFCTHTYVAM